MSILMRGYKKHTTGKLCLVALLGLLTFVDIISATDFEITEVMKIGPASLSVGEGPMKFSPSGDYLAYFIGTTLMLADSEGVSREIITLDMRPLQFEWQSEGEIVVLEYKSLGGPNDYRRLTRVDINTGQTLTLHEHYRDSNPDTPETERILSLKKTMRNQFAYKLGSEQGDQVIIPPSNYKHGDQNTALASDFYLEWGESQSFAFRDSRRGLFKVSSDGRTSVRIGPYFAIIEVFPPVFSRDLSYVMAASKILKVEDGTLLDLRSLFEVPGDMNSCTFVWSEFNPVVPEELLFNRYCYRETHTEDFESDYIGILNISSKEITVLDELVGMDNCRAPVYAPDGLSIAFVSDGIAYIIRREMK